MNRAFKLFLIVSVSCNLLLFFSLVNSKSIIKSNAINSEETFSSNPFLSKRIFAEQQNDIIVNFIPLRTALREYVLQQNDMVGMYFEYLPSGTSIGINDTEEVKLASLAKVPLVMSIYKKIERGELDRNVKLLVKPHHIDKKFGTLWQTGVGKEFTVDELVYQSLVESDNTSSQVLFGQLTPRELNEVYDNLDIPIEKEGTIPTISPKNYSSIFRSLYLSSFLTTKDSNEILEILSHSIFTDKIAAGVPEGIKVSHKIGVFDIQGQEPLFTDCGIVYVLNRPYTLCAFVRGTDEDAQKHISHISEIIYKYISIVQ